MSVCSNVNPFIKLGITGHTFNSQISKVAERILVCIFVPQLITTGAFGRNQFAYTPERGARDAIAQLVLTWLVQFGRKKKIAVYCSDVSGAFDKVNSRRLVRKLRAKGVPEEILAVLQSWLAARTARVSVGGKFSRDTGISDMVYQGTVLGRLLWNIFYEDVADAVHLHDFLEIVLQTISMHTKLLIVQQQMKHCMSICATANERFTNWGGRIR